MTIDAADFLCEQCMPFECHGASKYLKTELLEYGTALDNFQWRVILMRIMLRISEDGLQGGG